MTPHLSGSVMLTVCALSVSEGLQSEGKECRIHLLLIDKTLMKLCVQSIHQVFELSITFGGKVTQEEDFAGHRILHRVTKSADLIDDVFEHEIWSDENCVSLIL